MTLIALPPSQQLVDLVGTLGGTWHGRTAMCCCPAHADRKPSLSIRQGNAGILVTCFAGCDRADVLRELARVQIRGHFAKPASRSGGPGNARRLWDEAGPIDRTLAQRYLAARHLAAASDLRFHPRAPLRPRPWTTFQPALLVPVRENRDVVAVQRIFLDPVSASYRMKLMLGRPGQGAWEGEGVWTDTLALAEGFETARAFSQLHRIACWASMGARRYAQVRLPNAITRLILAGDNDAEGRRAVELAETVYGRPGLVIERCLPETHNDWADVLQSLQRR
jgi:hypothetical protein